MSYQILYPFTANFKDGSSYTQSLDDSPRISPIGSSFTDIKDRLEDIDTFCLHDLDSNRHILVDLKDGHFEYDGESHKDPHNLPLGTTYRLIYYRHVQQHLHSDGTTSTDVEYHAGWQATVDGKNYQHTVSVA
jgi:hypothetical protein